MKALQRVVWSEGMFMSPQHLQQQDAYHEAQLQARVEALSPHSWGVVSMELDGAALSAGQVQLQEFFGILPDGLVLRLERGHPEAPPARPVEETLGQGKRALDVFIGVAKEREGMESHTVGEARNGIARFSLATRPVPDQLGPSSVVPVVFAQRNVRLLFGNEPRDDFECIKVAEVTRDSLGALKFDETYVPPCLRIGASPFLLDGIRKVLTLMIAKQRELADTRRHRDASSLEFTASDVTRYLQLHALNAAIPVLNHFAEAGDAHPHLAYLSLLGAAGELSSFSADADPMALPKFQFTELGKTFADLFTRLNHLLRSLALEQCIQVPLETRPGGIHVGKLEDERFARCSQFILTVKSELSEQQVAEQLPRLSKIASLSEISRIVQAAAPGVPLQATFRPPPEVSVRPGVVYFSLATQDGYWKNAMRDRAVALFLPQPFDPSRTKIELLGVPGR
jgi:type VI secretion system protein ImpJ